MYITPLPQSKIAFCGIRSHIQCSANLQCRIYFHANDLKVRKLAPNAPGGVGERLLPAVVFGRRNYIRQNSGLKFSKT